MMNKVSLGRGLAVEHAGHSWIFDLNGLIYEFDVKHSGEFILMYESGKYVIDFDGQEYELDNGQVNLIHSMDLSGNSSTMSQVQDQMRSAHAGQRSSR